jgi:hypothetical protein
MANGNFGKALKAHTITLQRKYPVSIVTIIIIIVIQDTNET